ncbi:BppU family phage baseplate upper protein, partial [Clostridium perfringens]
MKEIFIDINKYSGGSVITATENDNNAETYKIIITEDDRRFDLTGKTVQLGYVLNYTSSNTPPGDVFNLNITNPAEGEITLTVTEFLTRKDGDYTCQLLILGENDYRRHSRHYFTISIRENLFNKISEEIEKDNINILNNLINGVE